MWNERVVSGRSIDVIHWKASRRNDWRGSVPGRREIPQQKLFHNNFYEDTFHRITGKFPFPSPQSSIDHTLFMLPITTPITSKTFRLIPKTHHTGIHNTNIRLLHGGAEKLFPRALVRRTTTTTIISWEIASNRSLANGKSFAPLLIPVPCLSVRVSVCQSVQQCALQPNENNTRSLA